MKSKVRTTACRVADPGGKWPDPYLTGNKNCSRIRPDRDILEFLCLNPDRSEKPDPDTDLSSLKLDQIVFIITESVF